MLSSYLYFYPRESSCSLERFFNFCIILTVFKFFIVMLHCTNFSFTALYYHLIYLQQLQCINGQVVSTILFFQSAIVFLSMLKNRVHNILIVLYFIFSQYLALLLVESFKWVLSYLLVLYFFFSRIRKLSILAK